MSILAVVLQTLETERVDTRQNSRVGEHLSTDGTLRHIIQFLASWGLTSHIVVRVVLPVK